MCSTALRLQSDNLILSVKKFSFWGLTLSPLFSWYKKPKDQITAEYINLQRSQYFCIFSLALYMYIPKNIKTILEGKQTLPYHIENDFRVMGSGYSLSNDWRQRVTPAAQHEWPVTPAAQHEWPVTPAAQHEWPVTPATQHELPVRMTCRSCFSNCLNFLCFGHNWRRDDDNVHTVL